MSILSNLPPNGRTMSLGPPPPPRTPHWSTTHLQPATAMQPSLLYFAWGRKHFFLNRPITTYENCFSIYEVYMNETIPGIGEGEGGVEAAVEAGQEQGSGIEQGTVG